MYHQLVKKYNVAAPRYTSYPTVPYWNNSLFDIKSWQTAVKRSFDESNNKDGISLYIHLPFCESLCTYCGCNTRITKNHAVEDPYIKAVLKEWDIYQAIMTEKPVIKEIHLGGGTPTFFSTGNLAKLIRGILKNAAMHPDAEFSFEAHPANTTVEHLEILYQLGFRRLSLGIQDFDPKVQFIINRHQSYEQVRVVTLQARRIGYTSVNYDLIYGLPLQTLDGLIDTMNKVHSLKPDRIAFYSYAHVPWIKPGQRLFTERHLPDAETKDKLYDVGRSLLVNYGYQEVGMDHFALPGDSLNKAKSKGSLHRNFMGYTHQHTQLLIGLGVSSISDSLYAFAQNSKTVEDYLKIINNNNELPIVKGHVLTGDDIVLRKHILNIMCTGETCWNDPNDICDSLLEGIGRLGQLEEDELVHITPSGLNITPLGKRFLRNICMAFDARLWAQQPESQLFSKAI